MNRHIRNGLAFCAVVVALIAAAGCGGERNKSESGSESEKVSTAPSKPTARVAYRIEVTKLGDVPLRQGRFSAFEDGLHVAIMVVAEDLPDAAKGGAKKTVISGDELWQMSVDGVRGPRFVDIDQQSVQFSPDGKRCAYFAKGADLKSVLVVDQKQLPQTAKHGGEICFSPDSQHLAFSLADENGETLYADGKEIFHGERIENVLMSPDGKHLAFVAYRNDRQRYIRDGVEGPEFFAVQNGTFSPDGKRFAYVARELRNGVESYYVLSDGRKNGPYSFAENVQFSADGKHFGYTARRGEGSVLGIDGREIDIDGELVWHSPIDETPPRTIYIKRFGKLSAVIVNGRHEKLFDVIDSVYFNASPDGKHYAYIGESDGKFTVMHDGNASDAFDDDAIWQNSLMINRDGTRAAYIVNGVGGSTVILNGREIAYADASLPVFSVDGKHMAYIAVRKTGDAEYWRLVIDGAAGKERLTSKAGLYSTEPRFSPDGLHVVSMVTHEVMLDDVAGPYFDEIVYPGPSFHPDGTLEYLIVKDDVLLRVKHVASRN